MKINGADSASLTNVASSATSVAVLAANKNRQSAVFVNDSTAICYLAYAATASTTAFTIEMPADAVWEMPATVCYTGVISAIWASANGFLRVTEMN